MPYTIDQGVTQSMLNSWRTCRYLSSLQLAGWRPKRFKTSFRFGSLVHDILEAIYRGMRADSKISTPKGIKRFIAGKVRENLSCALPSESMDEIELEGAFAEALLAGPYLRQWPEDFKRDWVGVESQFDYDFAGFRLRGKRDAVFRQTGKKGGGLWLLETKTKSRIEEAELELYLSFDFQSLFYLLSLAVANPGEEIKGCLYNIIRRPALRETEAKESREEFIERVGEDIRKRPDHYFKRYELVFTPKTLQEFKSDLLKQLAEFKEWQNGKLPTYKNPQACVGRFQCEFLEHCSSGTFAGYVQEAPFRELDGTRKGEKNGRRIPTRKTK